MTKSADGDSSEPFAYAEVLLELTPNIVVFLSPENHICRMSRSMREYLNVSSPEEIEGKCIQDLIENPILLLLIKKWLEKIDIGQTVDESFPLDIEHDDQYRWFHVKAKRVELEGKNAGKVFFISEETELYSQKKILDTIMSSFPGDMLVFDRTLRILIVSDSIARMNGFMSWRDVVGRSLTELVKVDLRRIEQMLNQVILKDDPVHQLVKVARGSNDPRWLYVDLRTIKSTAGTFGYIMTQWDMTGEIKPKTILEALMDSSSDCIGIINPDGIVEYASKSLAENMGIRNWRSTIGKPWSYLFKNLSSSNSGFAGLFSGDWTQQRKGTLSIDNPEGKAYLDYRIDPLEYQGENFGFLCVAVNTTEVIEAKDRAESAVRAKASFLANMSHELRTPMNAVLGMNELLSRTALTPLQKNYMAHIRSSAILLLSIINDILDFSRLEDRKVELQNAPYGFNSMLHDVVNMVGVKIVEKELTFTVDLDPQIPAIVVGDEIRVKQILINLLNNAVKFTDQGEINLSVSGTRSPSGKGVTLCFRVRDTGIGIPKDRQTELFERFSRIESQRNANVEGSGLGLSICRGLVSLMGGSLWLESDEGVGSTFIAEITQKVGDDSGCIAPLERGKPISLLAFDTSPYVIASLRQMVASCGVEARFCSDPATFAALVSAPDAPWTHVVFEYKSGYESAVRALPRLPGARWLSMLSLSDFIADGKNKSVDFVFKPIVLPVLAKFLQDEHVDFSLGLPLMNTLGIAPLYFRATGVVVLVVDDSAVNRKVAQGFLQTLDVRVDEAEDGSDALRLAGQRRYDLVLMDHLMPGMDGLETSARMREIPGYDRVPIIALTGNIGSSFAEMYRKAGMDDYLFKPIEFDAFVACLRKWLPEGKVRDVVRTYEDLPESSFDSGAANVAEPEDGDEASDWVPGLDQAVGIEYTGSLKNLVTILDVFRKSGPRLLAQLEEGRDSGDAAKFRMAAHSLISSIGNIGGAGLSSRARELEQAIIAGNAEGASQLYERVHDELESLVREVSAYLEKQRVSVQAEGSIG